MKSYDYPITIRPLSDAEGGGYLVEVPDLIGCMADGETVEGALQEIKDAIESWIKTAKKAGDAIPKPSVPENYSGQWRIRVPKHLHAELALKAKADGVSLNMLAATLLAEGVGRKRLSSPSSKTVRASGLESAKATSRLKANGIKAARRKAS